MPEWTKIENDISDFCLKLKKSIVTFPHEQNDPIGCSDCLLRMIALLWIQSKFKIYFIKNDSGSFWKTTNNNGAGPNNIKRHGCSWHNAKIIAIEAYLISNGFTATREPTLLYGRADLGAYRN